MKLSHSMRVGVCLFAVTISISAQAQDTSSEGDNAIIVVGQRDAPIEIVPRGLAVSMGEEQFKAVNAFNVEDLIKYAPNFFVRKRYSGDSNGVPGFRGTHSTQSARTLVMVDGFVVSNFLGNSFGFAPKWGVVGPGEVKQFDVVYGPYSSRYASRPNTDLFGLQRGDTFGYTSELFAIDAKVNWDISDRFRISAGVDNITNNRAWVFHPYPQRTFVLEVGVKL